MASEVDICNIALYRVGAERISSLSDNNKRAKICNDIYSFERDLLLREHPWNFATKRVSLAKTANTPEFGYDSEFQLPSDYVRVIDTEYGDFETFEYRVEGDKFLCDENSVKIEYVYQVTNTSLYDAKFTEALSLRIASRLAYSMVNSSTLQQQIFGEADLALRDARLFDAQEGSPRKLRKSDWTNVRP